MSRLFLLSRDDLPDAAALEAEHFPAPWSLEQFQSGHALGRCRVHGVRIEVALIGYISCQILPPEMEILNMAVRQDFRRCGLGRALVAAALEDGAALGINACYLEVDDTNLAAVHLYTILGFTPIGRRRNYYRHTEGARDAILMRCDPRCFAAIHGPKEIFRQCLDDTRPVALQPGGEQ